MALLAPYRLLRIWSQGNWEKAFWERCGRHGPKIKQAITNRHVIWLHAGSDDGINICTQLIKAIEPRAPNLKILVSVTTAADMREIQQKLPSHVEKVYYPIDRRKYVRRALGVLRPEAIVFVDADICPNFVWHAEDRGIPVFFVNGKLSPKTVQRYKRFGFLFRAMFASFAGVIVQDQKDALLFQGLGSNAESIHVVGGFEFQPTKLGERRLLNLPVLLRQLGVKEGTFLLLGANTGSGEENIIARSFQSLRLIFPDLFLVLVPSQIERCRQVGQELVKLGIKHAFRSDVTDGRYFKPGSVDCLLVNSIGELHHFYESAHVIVIGKSLFDHGGGDPMEVGSFGKAMIFGPNMQNFEKIGESFITAEGAIQVQNGDELEMAIDHLLSDPTFRSKLGVNALKVVEQNRSAMDRTVDIIAPFLTVEGIYVANNNRESV
jgi:3-deoxy-D-manno-octulosonic-acid transferase